MITKLTEQKGCIIAEFIDLKRFTLAVTEEVKSELKPILSQEGNKMIFDFKNIEFIDSSGIGCIISLVKTAKSNHSEIKLCNISSEVMDVLELLHLPMILDIEHDLASTLTSFYKSSLPGVFFIRLNFLTRELPVRQIFDWRIQSPTP